MNRKILLGVLASIAAALPQVLPHFFTPDRAAAVLSIVSAFGAIVTGVMRFTGDDMPPLPRPSGERRGLDMSAIEDEPSDDDA